MITWLNPSIKEWDNKLIWSDRKVPNVMITQNFVDIPRLLTHFHKFVHNNLIFFTKLVQTLLEIHFLHDKPFDG